MIIDDGQEFLSYIRINVGEVIQYGKRKSFGSGFLLRIGDEAEAGIHDNAVVFHGQGDILQQAKGIASYGFVDIGPLQVLQQLAEVFAHEFGVGDGSIGEWPGGALNYFRVFVVEEEVSELVESLRIITDPLYDFFAVGFGMFGEEGSAEHGG